MKKEKTERQEKFAKFTRFSLLGLLIASLLDVLLIFIPFINTFAGYLRILVFAGAFYVPAIRCFRGQDKKSAMAASAVAAVLLGLIGNTLFVLTPGIYVYCKVYSIGWFLSLYPPAMFLLLYALVVTYAYVFIYFMLSAWYEGRFKTSMRRIIVIVAVVLVLFFIISSAVSPNSGSTGGPTGEKKCSNCGGDGWDSANSCTCVWCGGDGITSWNP